MSEIINQKSEFFISDNYLLLEPIETRGENLELEKSSDEEKLFFVETLDGLKVKLMTEWAELISIIKSISFVKIQGKEDLLSHFSGSDTYRWGAMHMYKNLNPLNIAECITHEASHHWLNLYELYCSSEFISNGWDDESFISPWRNVFTSWSTPHFPIRGANTLGLVIEKVGKGTDLIDGLMWFCAKCNHSINRIDSL